MKLQNNIAHRQNGPALAAILSAGLGCAAIGVFTVLTEAFPAFKAAMNLWNPAGPLTGKTTAGVVVWLVSWAFLHLNWRQREIMAFGRVLAISLVFIGLGWLGTFPPFFELFAGE
jgi:hypothetical protein